MMLNIIYSSQFKKDFKKSRKLPSPDLKELFHVISILEDQKTLDVKYRDHMVGNRFGFRECHIKADWLLIYQVKDDKLQLARIGTHSELF